MKDIEILKQLLNGNHLTNKELLKAKKILNILNNEFSIRKIEGEIK